MKQVKIVPRPDTWKTEKSIKRRTKTTEIIVHCTATPAGHNFTADEIRGWHLARGWEDIGYHYIILLDGTICQGRQESLVGAHCAEHNHRSVGVAYVGGLDEHGTRPLDSRTPEQRLALGELLEWLHRRYPKASLHGHREFANKACPCFKVQEYNYIFQPSNQSSI